MRVPIQLFNPSPYRRGGAVTIPWPGLLDRVKNRPPLVEDASKTALRAQVDRPLPDRPERDSLSLLLADDELPARFDEDVSDASATVHLDLDRSPPEGWSEDLPGSPRAEATGNGVRLVNERLTVWFNLSAVLDPHRPEDAWYAGAATSIQLRGVEILDSNEHPLWHHLEKRALQVATIELPAGGGLSLTMPLFDRDYELLATGSGPVRCWLTAASAAFPYPVLGSDGRRLSSRACRLIRILSLYAGADHLDEELFLEETGGSGAEVDGGLEFVARYFSFLHIGPFTVSQFPGVPDWFALSARMRPFHGYGFATNLHAEAVASPDPGYPLVDRRHQTLSWRLFPGRWAFCVHAFTRFVPEDRETGLPWDQAEVQNREAARRAAEDRAGRLWYEAVYKPLWGRGDE